VVDLERDKSAFRRERADVLVLVRLVLVADVGHGRDDSRAQRSTTAELGDRRRRDDARRRGPGEEAVARIIKTIAVFDDFCHANDPHEEHEFGSFEAEGHMIFFKIDYLDRSLNHHTPDPTDPAVTVRVITVMLADEY
jgi:Protein of unknown function (DUF3768)